MRDYYPWDLRMPGRSLTSATSAESDFTGYQLDATNLHYAGTRDYMAALGRWTTTDPILEGTPKGLIEDGQGWLAALSPYHYSLNRPVSVTDPTGEFPIWDIADFGFAALNIQEAWQNPSLSNVGWAVADVGAAVAPGIPSAGLVRRGGQLFAKADDVARAVASGARRISEVSAGR